MRVSCWPYHHTLAWRITCTSLHRLFRNVQAITHHTVFSAFVTYSPIFSRVNRLSIALIGEEVTVALQVASLGGVIISMSPLHDPIVVSIASLFFSALFYGARHGAPGLGEASLPQASLTEVLVLSIMATAIQLPVTKFFTTLFEKVCNSWLLCCVEFQY